MRGPFAVSRYCCAACSACARRAAVSDSAAAVSNSTKGCPAHHRLSLGDGNPPNPPAEPRRHLRRLTLERPGKDAALFVTLTVNVPSARQKRGQH